MTPIAINDPGDPRLEPYRDIRERDLAGREGLFIAEGKVVLNVLFAAARFKPRSVLILENRLAGLAETLTLAPPDMPVYVASRQVMDTVAGFAIHRGILAIGERRADDDPAALLDGYAGRSVVVGLIGIANHDNIGAIFRNAAAFGADAVLMDETCCDPLYRKAVRVSVGAALKVPFARCGSAETLVETLQTAGYGVLALTPSAKETMSAAKLPDRVALLLGSEGDGLPPELLKTAAIARIAMREDFDSLNVATAAAIALHTLFER